MSYRLIVVVGDMIASAVIVITLIGRAKSFVRSIISWRVRPSLEGLKITRIVTVPPAGIARLGNSATVH
jgi:hypothetical protein